MNVILKCYYCNLTANSLADIDTLSVVDVVGGALLCLVHCLLGCIPELDAGACAPPRRLLQQTRPPPRSSPAQLRRSVSTEAPGDGCRLTWLDLSNVEACFCLVQETGIQKRRRTMP